MSGTDFSEEQVARFFEDGYILVKELFDGEEVDRLRKIAKADRQSASRAVSRRDGKGGTIQLVV
jgi:hypothetical protein